MDRRQFIKGVGVFVLMPNVVLETIKVTPDKPVRFITITSVYHNGTTAEVIGTDQNGNKVKDYIKVL